MTCERLPATEKSSQCFAERLRSAQWQRETAASIAAGWLVAWVDTPLMVLARFKQQYPALPYSLHLKEIYTARGLFGFYFASNGLHSWGRPNLLPGSSATMATIAWSSCQGIAVWETWRRLTSVVDQLGGSKAGTNGATSSHDILGQALCGAAAGCAGSLFSLPRDVLTNIVLAEEARGREHGRNTRVFTTFAGWCSAENIRLGCSWARHQVARVLLGPGRAICSQRAAMAALLAQPGGVSSYLLHSGWKSHMAGAMLFHASGFAVCIATTPCALR